MLAAGFEDFGSLEEPSLNKLAALGRAAPPPSLRRRLSRRGLLSSIQLACKASAVRAAAALCAAHSVRRAVAVVATSTAHSASAAAKPKRRRRMAASAHKRPSTGNCSSGLQENGESRGNVVAM